MKKIYLTYNEITLGYLTQSDSGYKFCANPQGIENASIQYPLSMAFFKLNNSGTKTYSALPQVFKLFLASPERRDLMFKAGIDESDDEFERLYKLSGLNMMSINFKLKQK